MLGGFKDRFDLPLNLIQKFIDKSTSLMEKTIEYLADAQILTRRASQLADKLELLIEADRNLKTLEAERLKMEIEILEMKRGRFDEDKKHKSGGRKRGGLDSI